MHADGHYLKKKRGGAKVKRDVNKLGVAKYPQGAHHSLCPPPPSPLLFADWNIYTFLSAISPSLFPRRLTLSLSTLERILAPLSKQPLPLSCHISSLASVCSTPSHYHSEEEHWAPPQTLPSLKWRVRSGSGFSSTAWLLHRCGSKSGITHSSVLH